MATSNNGINFDRYVYSCSECKSKMIFEMTFYFETDIDVYCPCTSIMEYLGPNT